MSDQHAIVTSTGQQYGGLTQKVLDGEMSSEELKNILALMPELEKAADVGNRIQNKSAGTQLSIAAKNVFIEFFEGKAAAGSAKKKFARAIDMCLADPSALSQFPEEMQPIIKQGMIAVGQDQVASTQITATLKRIVASLSGSTAHVGEGIQDGTGVFSTALGTARDGMQRRRDTFREAAYGTGGRVESDANAIKAGAQEKSSDREALRDARSETAEDRAKLKAQRKSLSEWVATKWDNIIAPGVYKNLQGRAQHDATHAKELGRIDQLRKLHTALNDKNLTEQLANVLEDPENKKIVWDAATGARSINSIPKELQTLASILRDNLPPDVRYGHQAEAAASLNGMIRAISGGQNAQTAPAQAVSTLPAKMTLAEAQPRITSTIKVFLEELIALDPQVRTQVVFAFDHKPNTKPNDPLYDLDVSTSGSRPNTASYLGLEILRKVVIAQNKKPKAVLADPQIIQITRGVAVETSKIEDKLPTALRFMGELIQKANTGITNLSPSTTEQTQTRALPAEDTVLIENTEEPTQADSQTHTGFSA